MKSSKKQVLSTIARPTGRFLRVGDTKIAIYALNELCLVLAWDLIALLGTAFVSWRDRVPGIENSQYSQKHPVQGMGGYRRALLTLEGAKLFCAASSRPVAHELFFVLGDEISRQAGERPRSRPVAPSTSTRMGATRLPESFVCAGIELRRYFWKDRIWVRQEDIEKYLGTQIWRFLERTPELESPECSIKIRLDDLGSERRRQLFSLDGLLLLLSMVGTPVAGDLWRLIDKEVSSGENGMV